MSEKQQRAREIFEQAIEISDPVERIEFVPDQCGGDSDLLGQVEKLLAANDEATGLFRSGDADEECEFDLKQADGEHKDETRSLGQPALENEDQIIAGRYKLRQNIGEGGMGSVWVAEQFEPVKRKVAIKMIKAGMDSKQVLARFNAERQALALMDHPNIAKVFDGGMTEQGRPYFVMEYVKGIPFTDYCDQARVPLKERLELFIPVCQAIQHAHQKGIVHRDLKPSNILICLYDGKPVPKVIDFGLAKALHQPLTEQSIFTGHGMMVGTPIYMSPEQAELNNLDVDTRTDIYSLGVMLYELLVGSTPLEKAQFKEAAFNEVLRIIKEVEPPRPSTRLSGSASLPNIAAQRNIDPKQLCKSMAGELDWIVMKSLEKERTRRYETANGLASDLMRFLAGDPVEAAPPSRRYRLQKFVTKNKTSVWAASSIFIALTLGTILAVWGYSRARQAEIITMSALNDVTVEKDEKEKALAISEARRKLAERNLCLGILRPIGFDTEPLGQAELNAFVDWSKLEDSLRLEVLDVAFEDVATIRRLARRTERAIQALTGSSLELREKALRTIRRNYFASNDKVLRSLTCKLALELASTDDFDFVEATNFFVNDNETTKAESYAFFDSLISNLQDNLQFEKILDIVCVRMSGLDFGEIHNLDKVDVLLPIGSLAEKMSDEQKHSCITALINRELFYVSSPSLTWSNADFTLYEATWANLLIRKLVDDLPETLLEEEFALSIANLASSNNGTKSEVCSEAIKTIFEESDQLQLSDLLSQLSNQSGDEFGALTDVYSQVLCMVVESKSTAIPENLILNQDANSRYSLKSVMRPKIARSILVNQHRFRSEHISRICEMVVNAYAENGDNILLARSCIELFSLLTDKQADSVIENICEDLDRNLDLNRIDEFVELFDHEMPPIDNNQNILPLFHSLLRLWEKQDVSDFEFSSGQMSHGLHWASGGLSSNDAEIAWSAISPLLVDHSEFLSECSDTVLVILRKLSNPKRQEAILFLVKSLAQAESCVEVLDILYAIHAPDQLANIRGIFEALIEDESLMGKPEVVFALVQIVGEKANLFGAEVCYKVLDNLVEQIANAGGGTWQLRARYKLGVKGCLGMLDEHQLRLVLEKSLAMLKKHGTNGLVFLIDSLSAHPSFGNSVHSLGEFSLLNGMLFGSPPSASKYEQTLNFEYGRRNALARIVGRAAIGLDVPARVKLLNQLITTKEHEFVSSEIICDLVGRLAISEDIRDESLLRSAADFMVERGQSHINFYYDEEDNAGDPEIALKLFLRLSESDRNSIAMKIIYRFLDLNATSSMISNQYDQKVLASTFLKNALSLVTDLKSLRSCLYNPGAIGNLRESILLRIEEVICHEGEPVFVPKFFERSSKSSTWEEGADFEKVFGPYLLKREIRTTWDAVRRIQAISTRQQNR